MVGCYQRGLEVERLCLDALSPATFSLLAFHVGLISSRFFFCDGVKYFNTFLGGTAHSYLRYH